jgi:hypothetical protein
MYNKNENNLIFLSFNFYYIIQFIEFKIYNDNWNIISNVFLKKNMKVTKIVFDTIMLIFLDAFYKYFLF